MALKPNAQLKFVGYKVTHAGLEFTFLAPDPGEGEESFYVIFGTDAELAAVASIATFNTFVLDKLKRLVRANGIASKLDSMIGRSITLP